MKSIATPHKKPSDPKFPCLMVDPSDGMVILFTGKNTGTIVHTGTCKTLTIGDFSSDWCDGFIPYTGSVTLSND